MILYFLWALPVLESITCSISSKQRPTIHLPSLQCFVSTGYYLFTLAVLLLLFHYRYHHFYHHRYYHRFTVAINTFVQASVYFRCGWIENSIVKSCTYYFVPKCRINKLGYLAREDYLDPLQLRVIKYCFLVPLPGSIDLFTGLLEVSYLLHVIHYG